MARLNPRSKYNGAGLVVARPVALLVPQVLAVFLDPARLASLSPRHTTLRMSRTGFLQCGQASSRRRRRHRLDAPRASSPARSGLLDVDAARAPCAGATPARARSSFCTSSRVARRSAPTPFFPGPERPVIVFAPRRGCRGRCTLFCPSSREIPFCDIAGTSRRPAAARVGPGSPARALKVNNERLHRLRVRDPEALGPGGRVLLRRERRCCFALSSLPPRLLLPRESCPLLTMAGQGDLPKQAPRATTAPLTSRAGQR